MDAIILANGTKYLVFSESDDLCMFRNFECDAHLYTIYNNWIQHSAETRGERRKARDELMFIFIWTFVKNSFGFFLLISMCCIGLFIYHSVCVFVYTHEKIHWNIQLPVAADYVRIFTMLERRRKKKGKRRMKIKLYGHRAYHGCVEWKCNENTQICGLSVWLWYKRAKIAHNYRPLSNVNKAKWKWKQNKIFVLCLYCIKFNNSSHK